MRINYNVSAMLSNNALANNDNLLSRSLERLSSGLKINHAKDNPAGLAMAKRMNAQIEGLSVASQNASDGISIIETADGAMTEISEMLQRMSELAIKAANGPLTSEDTETIQAEIRQLKEEITRVSDSTEFNGQKLLNGEFELKGYVEGDLDVKVSGYSKDVPTGVYIVNELTVSKEVIDGTETGNYIVSTFDVGVNLETGAKFPDNITAEMKEGLVIVKGANNFEMTFDLNGVDLDTKSTFTNFKVDATGIGAMRMQIGANEGQVLAIEIPAVSLRNMGIENLDVSTTEGAQKGIESIKGAISFVSSVRGKLGAYQNRLESTTNSLGVTSENMTAAYSRIMDVDMAEEMTEYTTAQILTQAGTSMLAQANERPSQVLQLLQ